MAGQQYGDFRLLAPLEQDGVAERWKALQLSLDRPVSLTLVRLPPEREQRFLERARDFARLAHPAVQPVYAAGSQDGTCYLAARLDEGPTLEELLERGLPLFSGLFCLERLVEGLAVVHAAGLVHGQVTAGNVRLIGEQPVLVRCEAGWLDGADLSDTATDLTSAGELLQAVLHGKSCPPALLDVLEAIEAGRAPALDALQAGLREALAGRGEPTLPGGMALAPTRIELDVQPAAPAGINVAGERFGKYELRALLGQGGMGLVYRAWQSDLQREVALKVLAGGGGVERFLVEARSAARLRHPGIVPIYEVGQHEDRHYFTMELVEGQDLWALIEAGAISVRHCLEIAAGVARAVEHAHEQGVLHRDLKPENILIEASSGRPRVADFGLARSIENDGSGRALTCAGALLGTPAFMAPEQARAESHRLDRRTEVYGLGALLYAMLTGRPPFEGSDPMSIVLQVCEQDPVPPRAHRPGLPADVQTICLKAMAKQPERRYPTAVALADDIERWLAGLPIEARPPSALYRARRWLARNRGLALAAVVVVATLLGAAVVVRGMRRQAAGAQQEARRELAATREDQRWREQTLQPLADRIKGARAFLYVREIAIGKKLAEVGEALQRLEQLVRDPRLREHPETWRLLGGGRYLLRDLDGARQALEQVLRLQPDDPFAHAQLGRIALERLHIAQLSRKALPIGDELERRQAQALRHLQRATDRWAGARPIDRHVLVAYQALARRDGPAVKAAFREGLSRFAGEPGREELWMVRALTERGEQRIASFGRVLEICPHHALALLARGTLLGAAGRHVEALPDLDRALALGSRLPEGFFSRGNSRLALRRFRGAAADYTEALRRDPRMFEALVNRAVASLGLGQDPRALADLDRALQLAPKSDLARYQRGRLHWRAGRLAQAIADYDVLIEIQPRNVSGLIERGDCQLRLGRRAAAVADFRRAIEADPRSPLGHHALGSLWLAEGRIEQAIASYDQALVLDPDLVDARANRGICHLRRQDYARARTDLDRAVALQPHEAGHWYNRAQLFNLQHQAERAIADYSEAIRRKPDHVDALVNRGTLHYQAGRRKQAIADYEQALARAPKGWPHRAAVQGFLDQLRKR